MTQNFTTILDDIDLRLLRQLQHNADISNQQLASLLHLSTATCLRRVRRLKDLGYIARTVCHLNPDVLAETLSAIIEVTLEIQTSDQYALFESLVARQPAVQQCYRVSPGPDFVLITYFSGMSHYHDFIQQLSTTQHNIRNIKTFFITHRSKFTHELIL